MRTYPDRTRAERVFNQALAKAASDDDLPAEWVDRVRRVAEARAATYFPMLGTALLARATDARVDPLTLKAGAPHARGLRSYSARGLGHEVLVPLSQRNGIDLRVHGREPLNNSPFFRADRVGGDLNPKDPHELEYLINCLERIKDLSREEALQAFAVFIRHGRAAHAAAAVPIPILPSNPSLAALIAATAAFVASDPESGRRGQAMVAATFDVLLPAVETRNVFASDRRLPGDVVLRRDGAEPVPIEVRQKPVAVKDVIAFLSAVQSAGLHEAGYVAIDPRQLALRWDELVRLAAKTYGIALWIEASSASLLARTASLAPHGRFVAEFPRLMLDRLQELEASRQGCEEWAALFAAGATPTGAAPAWTAAPPRPTS